MKMLSFLRKDGIERNVGGCEVISECLYDFARPDLVQFQEEPKPPDDSANAEPDRVGNELF